MIRSTRNVNKRGDHTLNNGTINHFWCNEINDSVHLTTLFWRFIRRENTSIFTWTLSLSLCPSKLLSKQHYSILFTTSQFMLLHMIDPSTHDGLSTIVFPYIATEAMFAYSCKRCACNAYLSMDKAKKYIRRENTSRVDNRTWIFIEQPKITENKRHSSIDDLSKFL